jgi:hypothetical protein
MQHRTGSGVIADQVGTSTWTLVPVRGDGNGGVNDEH